MTNYKVKKIRKNTMFSLGIEKLVKGQSQKNRENTMFNVHTWYRKTCQMTKSKKNRENTIFILGIQNSSNDKVKKICESIMVSWIIQTRKTCEIAVCQNRKKWQDREVFFFFKFIVKVNLDTFRQHQ